jgi:Kef-type K+ transport system membrane component KefB
MKEFLSHILEKFQLPLTNPVPVFALILLIILIAPILLNRLKIPGIIGLIVSGILIGPYGLNIIENSDAVELFATIGLLYIMFMAGLDLDLNEFIVNRNKSLLFGFLTFALPFSMGFPVAYYLFGYNLDASILIASLFSTHTLVAYPIVSKYMITKNQAVAITVGGTILTDTAVLILLAIIMGKRNGELNMEFWIRFAISLITFSFIMFYIVPKIARWFFKKMENEKHAHYIFVLLVVFLSAFMSQVAGLEPIIGAFISGLVLNRLIPHSSALMNRIEFIGNSLFIPFFLISVGMIVDLRVILNGPTALIIAGTLLIIALSSKWLAAFFVQIIFKYSKIQRNLIFGLSSSHAAAALVVILVAYKAKILDEHILNGTIILILVSCIVASFVTEKAAKQLVIYSENNGEQASRTNIISEEYILIPIANYSNINKLVEFALMIKALKSASPISLLSIVPNNSEAEKNIIKSKRELQQYVKQAAATENKINIISTIDHNPASGIARISREIMANLVIIGWPKLSSVRDKVIGETIASIVNQVDKTIFICCFKNPLIVHSQIILITPPFAEKEYGFTMWINKMTRISFELSLPIIIFGNSKTHEHVRHHLKKNNFKAVIQYNLFDDWEDFLVLSRVINANDLIVLISTRKGYVSYFHELDNLPNKLEKHFESNSKIIVYPQQIIPEHHDSDFDYTTLTSRHKAI